MIRLIAAIDLKRGIAKNGFQPWYIPADEEYFQSCTKLHGGNVLMGKNTFSVIKRPLAKRNNFVVTRHPDGPLPRLTYVEDLPGFLADLKQDMWVIGGGQLYQQTIDQAQELYLTFIEADFGCDTFFPEYDKFFQESHTSEPQQQNGFNYTYKIFTRR